MHLFAKKYWDYCREVNSQSHSVSMKEWKVTQESSTLVSLLHVFYDE